MRLRQPAQLDTRAILSAALDAKGESQWHKNPGPDGIYRWHASSLAMCQRQQILKRAAGERGEFTLEEERLETRLVFDLGHYYHGMLQTGLTLAEGYTLIGTEIGGHHPEMPLAALADIVYSFEGEPIILEVKTESTYAAKRRREEAYVCEDGTTVTAARKEHCVQVAAQALVLDSFPAASGIAQGWIAYIDKETGAHDQQPVVIGPELRAHAASLVDRLERYWQRYLAEGTLPDLLPDELKVDKRSRPPREYFAPSGLCRARSDSDPRGLYCRVREECMTRAAKL